MTTLCPECGEKAVWAIVHTKYFSSETLMLVHANNGLPKCKISSGQQSQRIVVKLVTVGSAQKKVR